jgi:hypothetical protein
MPKRGARKVVETGNPPTVGDNNPPAVDENSTGRGVGLPRAYLTASLVGTLFVIIVTLNGIRQNTTLAIDPVTGNPVIQNRFPVVGVWHYMYPLVYEDCSNQFFGLHCNCSSAIELNLQMPPKLRIQYNIGKMFDERTSCPIRYATTPILSFATGKLSVHAVGCVVRCCEAFYGVLLSNPLSTIVCSGVVVGVGYVMPSALMALLASAAGPATVMLATVNIMLVTCKQLGVYVLVVCLLKSVDDSGCLVYVSISAMYYYTLYECFYTPENNISKIIICSASVTYITNVLALGIGDTHAVRGMLAVVSSVSMGCALPMALESFV